MAQHQQLPVSLSVEKDAIAYNMNHANRGLAIIFVHENFAPQTDLTKRCGTREDKDRLVQTLKALSFEVRVHIDKTQAEILEILHQASSEEDHTHNDCILVAVITHGDTGLLCSYDSFYRPEKLSDIFMPDKCLSLVGKPKIFLIQACRGKNKDSGIKVDYKYLETDAGISNKLPINTDFLLVFSSFPGYVSYSRERVGSWFIQSFCDVFDKFGSTLEINANLTMVKRKVAQDFDTKAKHPINAQKKQVPCIVSTLTRDLYFYRKP